MIHTNLPQSCGFSFYYAKLTRLAIYWSQTFDSHKWLILLVDEVKGKPCDFEAKNIFLPICIL